MNNNTIKFYNDKITTFEYDEKKQDWVEVEILKEHPEEITKYFDDDVIFDEELTFGNFIKLLLPAEKELNYVFFSFINGWPLKVFAEEMEKEPTSDAVYESIEFFWICNSVEGKLDFYGSLQGWPLEEKRESDYDGPYGLDFVKMNDLKNAKLVVNNQFILFETNEAGVITDKGVLFSGELEWTLHQALSALFREISYYGSPENRDTIIKEVDNKMKMYSEGEVDFEEEDVAKLALLKERMEEALDEEDYKMASKLKKKIEEINKRINNSKKPEE